MSGARMMPGRSVMARQASSSTLTGALPPPTGSTQNILAATENTASWSHFTSSVTSGQPATRSPHASDLEVLRHR